MRHSRRSGTGRHRLPADQVVHDHCSAVRLEVEVHADQPLVVEAPAEGVLPFRFTVEKQEAPAAGAHELSTLGAAVERYLVPTVDGRITDASREGPLRDP